MSQQQLGHFVQTRDGRMRIIAEWHSDALTGRRYVILEDDRMFRFMAGHQLGKRIDKLTSLVKYTDGIPREARMAKGVHRFRALQKCECGRMRKHLPAATPECKNHEHFVVQRENADVPEGD